MGDDRGHQDDGEKAMDGGNQAVEGQGQVVLEDEENPGQAYDQAEDQVIQGASNKSRELPGFGGDSVNGTGDKLNICLLRS
jgi:hypothetical protein